MFQQGRVGKSKLVIVRALPNGLKISRVAVVTGRAIGNAIARNRTKRRLRAAYRLQKSTLPDGYDFVLLARHRTRKARFQDLVTSIGKAIEEVTSA